MGKTSKALPVKLIIGLISRDEKILKKTQQILIRRFGSLELTSPVWNFDQTTYYTGEMGPDLKRLFLSFRDLEDARKLPAIKLFTNQLEKTLSKKSPHRVINIDPGYISLPKLVLATTKNYSHRLYIAKGIFEEVTLSFKENTFVPWPWTYPDFRNSTHIDFFNTVRNNYYTQIKERYGLAQISQCP